MTRVTSHDDLATDVVLFIDESDPFDVKFSTHCIIKQASGLLYHFINLYMSTLVNGINFSAYVLPKQHTILSVKLFPLYITLRVTNIHLNIITTTLNYPQYLTKLF